MFTFKKISSFDAEVFAELNKLLLQWKKGYQIKPAYFKTFIKKSQLLGVFDGKKLIGTVTLVELPKLSGIKGSIEHLIIDKNYRGKGLGRKLMEFAIEKAKKAKIETLFLTCEPEREAANALYQKLGFAIKETNFYYLDLL